VPAAARGCVHLRAPALTENQLLEHADLALQVVIVGAQGAQVLGAPLRGLLEELVASFEGRDVLLALLVGALAILGPDDRHRSGDDAHDAEDGMMMEVQTVMVLMAHRRRRRSVAGKPPHRAKQKAAQGGPPEHTVFVLVSSLHLSPFVVDGMTVRPVVPLPRLRNALAETWLRMVMLRPPRPLRT